LLLGQKLKEVIKLQPDAVHNQVPKCERFKRSKKEVPSNEMQKSLNPRRESVQITIIECAQNRKKPIWSS